MTRARPPKTGRVTKVAVRLPGGGRQRAFLDLGNPTVERGPNYSGAELADQLRQAGISTGKSASKAKAGRKLPQPRDERGRFMAR